MTKEYDLIVLGAGNAGFAPAGMAKEAGQSVLVVEGRDFGGTCALRGCVPKKVLVAAGETLEHIASAAEHKIDAKFNSLDWPALIERKETFVEGVPDMMEGSLTNREIDTISGRAKFTDSNEIEVNGERFTAKILSSGPARKTACFLSLALSTPLPVMTFWNYPNDQARLSLSARASLPSNSPMFLYGPVQKLPCWRLHPNPSPCSMKMPLLR